MEEAFGEDVVERLDHRTPDVLRDPLAIWHAAVDRIDPTVAKFRMVDIDHDNAAAESLAHLRHYAGTSRTLPSFQMIIGNPRRRSSTRFLRVARRWACDATRAHLGISFSAIGFSPLRDVFMRVRGTLVNR